jgi:hypothetical protein
MLSSQSLRAALATVACLSVAAVVAPEAQARPRRPNTAQIKKAQEQMKFLQQDAVRYQREVAAKEREIFMSFDTNNNGHLEGGEKARYDKYIHAVKQGRELSPFAGIAPVGKGPKDTAAKSGSK